MTSSFAALKKARSSSFDKLNQQLQQAAGNKSNNKDENYWKPDVDKAGNGYAVIRFLPAPEGEDFAWVKVHDHGFQGPGGWYIENSLTTLGQDDPVSEFNSKLWNASSDDKSPERAQARAQKRRTNFHANVYVVKDSANPQNEGKVFLYKFGKKIMEKLLESMNPQYEGETPVNPFDLWEGADFKLKIRNYEGYRNYDRSEFSEPAQLMGPKGEEFSDEQLEAIWKQEHSLKAIVDPKNFKTYAELSAKLHKVLGLDGNARDAMKPAAEDSDEMEFTPKFKERSAPKAAETIAPSFSASSDDDDDTLDFFKNLAAEE